GPFGCGYPFGALPRRGEGVLVTVLSRWPGNALRAGDVTTQLGEVRQLTGLGVDGLFRATNQLLSARRGVCAGEARVGAQRELAEKDVPRDGRHVSVVVDHIGRCVPVVHAPGLPCTRHIWLAIAPDIGRRRIVRLPCGREWWKLHIDERLR